MCCRNVVVSEDAPVTLSRLLPAGDPATISEIVEELGLWERLTPAPQHPRVLLNMVSTVDGRATLQGRSGPLSDRADRALFHGLRSAVDAVLVGAGTVRVERYGRMIPSSARRDLRVERGLAAEPLACVVSERLELGQAPLLGEPDARVLLMTSSADSLPHTAAHVDYIRAGSGALDLGAAIGELRERFSVQTVLCEGGPHLACQLLAAGLVDELFLSLSPTLAGGDHSGEECLRILAGEELTPALNVELLGVLQSDSGLFLRYGVSERARVSRATMLSSSLAS